ncbi:phosphoribosylglycinamide formyltransferase [Novispirillum itersonii]|uniref:Phosphoribosylglycinamide formyltransferase n=1 Tax=Novispirillum itersonii TaxID=189 RepID=A0A7W9ZI16_NOVIT|nr:phosphoribosylglycinamide formyltransferase [Novispirillum itersonii]MBB6211866.1 phosphoribosylglycinamide formyltransferase-1 [Novispirillum itersonii]
MTDRKLRVGVLASGRGSNLQALIDACADPSFPVEIVHVLSNSAGAYALERAEQAGIPTSLIRHKDYPSREAFDAAVDARLRDAGVGFVCLAGFMRLLSEGFVRGWEGRMINIHPSLLPSFKGLHTHEQALTAGVKLHGCTVHFVRPALDDGPILAQAAVPVLPEDTPDTLAARVLEQEHRLYPLALRLIAEGKAVIDGDIVRITGAAAGGALANPLPQ